MNNQINACQVYGEGRNRYDIKGVVKKKVLNELNKLDTNKHKIWNL